MPEEAARFPRRYRCRAGAVGAVRAWGAAAWPANLLLPPTAPPSVVTTRVGMKRDERLAPWNHHKTDAVLAAGACRPALCA